MAVRRKWPMRLSYILAALLLALVAWLVWRERAGVIGAWPYLRQANYWWLAVACAGAILYFAVQGAAVSRLFGAYGRQPGMLLCTGILFQTIMLNEVVPTAGVAGSAGFVYWGDRLGLGLRDSVAVSLWYLFLSYLALAPLIALCLRALPLVSPANARLIGAGLVTAGAVTAGVLLVLLCAAKFGRTRAANAANRTHLTRLARVISSYTHMELSKEWSRARSCPRPFLYALLVMTASAAIRVVMLRSCFAAVHVAVPFNTVLFAYAITQLLATVSPAPTTLGVVEVAYTASFSWFGLPVSAALAGTVLYRIASFWLPIPVGLGCGWGLNRMARRLSDDAVA